MLLEAQVLIASGAAASEFPTTCTLPHRVERVRWFLLPTEAWHYFHGHGQTDLTRTTFAPRSYRQKTKSNLISTKQQGHDNNNHGKTPHDKTAISRNKSFTLHIREEPDEEPASSALRTMHTEWLSMDALDRDCSTSPSCAQDPVTSGNHYASCEDLGEPATYSRKGRKRKAVKIIKKKLKSFLWPTRL